jgi:hypothetical protein
MENIQAYNRLMVAPFVYEALSGYSHVLIHEPDALVLKDELDYWCSQPFDYIGAPWFAGATPAPSAPLFGAGNFGFSLHRLNMMKKVLRSWRRWYPYDQIARDVIGGLLGQQDRLREILGIPVRADPLSTNGKAELLRRGIGGLGTAGRLRGAWKLYNSHCDMFWSRIVPRIIPEFSVAPPAAAVRFSWEVLPDRCYEMCGGQLPFGIHAWAKHNLPFLLPLLEANGVELVPNEVKNGLASQLSEA